MARSQVSMTLIKTYSKRSVGKGEKLVTFYLLTKLPITLFQNESICRQQIKCCSNYAIHLGIVENIMGEELIFFLSATSFYNNVFKKPPSSRSIKDKIVWFTCSIEETVGLSVHLNCTVYSLSLVLFCR